MVTHGGRVDSFNSIVWCSASFPVEIVATKTVRALKDVIKDAKRPAFGHVDAATPVLWKVSILIDKSFQENLDKLDFDEGKSLSPMEVLEDLFLKKKTLTVFTSS